MASSATELCAAATCHAGGTVGKELTKTSKFNPFTAMLLGKRPLRVQHFKPFSLFLFFFHTGMRKDLNQKCMALNVDVLYFYRTGKYTFCMQVGASFSPETLQAGGSEGVNCSLHIPATQQRLSTAASAAETADWSAGYLLGGRRPTVAPCPRAGLLPL